MIEGLNPAFILIFGALLLPLVPVRLRGPWLLTLPVLGLWQFGASLVPARMGALPA